MSKAIQMAKISKDYIAARLDDEEYGVVPKESIVEKLNSLVEEKREHKLELERLASQPKVPFVHDKPQVGRNDPCPCGSGKKYKKCCLMNE